MFNEATYCHPKGERDAEGRFEPFYVPRPVMPQVDEADYPALLDFLTGRGIKWERVTIPASDLRFHQRVNGPVADMPEAIEDKDLLISLDLYVLDGNHREKKHLEDETPAPCIMLHVEFPAAIEALFAFPKTYTPGEDGQTIRN